MFKVINIGEEKVGLLTKASTNAYYKTIFHDDPIAIQTKDDAGLSEQVEYGQRLTFIMSKQAEAQNAVSDGKATSVRDFMQTVTEEDYLDWLDKFDFMDLQDASKEAVALYAASSKSTSTAKKE